MKWLLRTFKSRQMRRLPVALVVTGAGAAVAAGVVWAERANDRSLPASASVELVTGAIDPATDAAGAGSAVPGDVSLPDAKEALKNASREATEAAPTF